MVGPHGALTPVGLKATSSVIGFVTQCMVRSPETLYLSPPAFATLLDLKAISGHLAVSKKLGLRRSASRFSLWVSTLAASMVRETVLLVGSSLSQLSVEATLLNCPRTVVTIMCLTAKEALECTGSA